MSKALQFGEIVSSLPRDMPSHHEHIQISNSKSKQTRKRATNEQKPSSLGNPETCHLNVYTYRSLIPLLRGPSYLFVLAGILKFISLPKLFF